MVTQRQRFSAVLLPNGKVLVAGGCTNFGCTTIASTAELYDPAASTFASTGNMAVERHRFSMAVLNTGKVLVAGGCAGASECSTKHSSAELYDPASGTFTATGNLIENRTEGQTVLLPSGQVLVVGGGGPSRNRSSAELFNPSTGTFTLTTGGLNTARSGHTA